MDKITLSPGRVSALLDEVCIKYGYCEAGWSSRRLANSPPKTIDGFTDVVIKLEGMDPIACDHREELRAIVERHFIAESETAELARKSQHS
jgi:hypothetical protein